MGIFDRLFRPTCPCDASAKAWVEQRLNWLRDEFPDNVFDDKPVIVPTRVCFPDAFSPTPEGLAALARRIAAWIGVDPSRYRLEIDRLGSPLALVDVRGRAAPAGAAGLYEQDSDISTIVIDENELHHPENLVGTLAHEFAHERLMGEGRLNGDEFDNELLTDLSVIHLGLGVFLANAPRNWPAQQSTWPGTRLVRPEYMSPPMFGYALAHIAWHAGDRNPPWRKHLGPSVYSDFQQGVRYLFRTGDSEFRPAGASRR